MKRKYSMFLALAGLLATGISANAGERLPFGNGQLPEIMAPFDVDGDGKLNAEERQAFQKAMREKAHDRVLAEFDADGDGKLSEDELKAAREAMRAKFEEKRGDRFDELDKDDDGYLSKEEFTPPVPLPAGALDRIFAHLDKDGDGKISKEEFLRGLRPPGRPPGGGGGGGGEPPPPPPPPPPLPEWQKPYDVDNNGIIDREEMEAIRADIESGKLVPPGPGR